jgi:cation diffusion facilitator CzcD-associated flavoprotein CzcO
LTSLNDPNIELTTLPLQELHENSVTLGPRRIYPDPNDTTSLAPNHPINIPANVIILANGYDVGKWFQPLKIVGRDSKTLQDVFDERGGPQLYMGTAMDGFPNFFAIFGPNTATGHSSVILATENSVNLSLKFIKPILEDEIAETEIKKEAEVAWAEDIQRACKNTVWHKGGCNSWYKEENDWNSTTYP